MNILKQQALVFDYQTALYKVKDFRPTVTVSTFSYQPIPNGEQVLKLSKIVMGTQAQISYA